MGLAFFSTLVYLPIYWFFLPKALQTVPPSMMLLHGIYQGVIATTVAGMLYAYANLTIGPMKATLKLALVPITSALAAVPVLGENIGLLTWCGLALVTGGDVLGAMNPNK